VVAEAPPKIRPAMPSLMMMPTLTEFEAEDYFRDMNKQEEVFPQPIAQPTQVIPQIQPRK
jgi:hypothetical protein